MNVGLLGKKVGMTRVFTEDGVSIPVTVVLVVPNRVSQVKTLDTDKYQAVQMIGGSKKPSKVSKPLAGHLAKAQVEAGDMICEYRLDSIDNFQPGQVFGVADIFTEGEYVDVTGTSKGKGFAGTVKRYNFRTQDATHGNSRSHRVPGSIGQNQTPGKVFKGKKMAGHMGNAQCTTQSLKLVRIDAERNLLLIKGAIPGAPGCEVRVRQAVKKQKKVGA